MAQDTGFTERGYKSWVPDIKARQLTGRAERRAGEGPARSWWEGNEAGHRGAFKSFFI